MSNPKYQINSIRDDGTAQIRMTIGSSVLDQDVCFPIDVAEVKHALAIFKADLDRNAPVDVSDFEELIGVSVDVPTLPTIPPEDFETLNTDGG